MEEFLICRFWILLASVVVLNHTAQSFVPENELIPHENATQRYSWWDPVAVLKTSSEYKVFGRNYSNFYINGHGMVSLKRVGKYQCGYCYLYISEVPIFAPYIKEHEGCLICKDALELGWIHITYEELTFKKTPSHFFQIKDDIRIAFPNHTNELAKMIVVTWPNMNHTEDLNKRWNNIFQLIVASDNSNTYVLFYFNRIEWPSGSLYRGTALSGIFGGNINTLSSYLIPGSCSHTIRNIAGMSNIQQPGKFVFKVDSDIQFPHTAQDCDPLRGRININVKPKIVPAFGTLPLVLEGVNFCLDYKITRIRCTYWNEKYTNILQSTGVEVPGHIALLCPTPTAFQSLGLHQLKIKIDFSTNSNNETVEIESYVFVVMNRARVTANIRADTLFLSPERSPKINGNLESVLSNRLGSTINYNPIHMEQTLDRNVPLGWWEIYSNSQSYPHSSITLSGTMMEYFLNSSQTIMHEVIRYRMYIENGNYVTSETASYLDISNNVRNFNNCGKISNKHQQKYTQQQHCSCPYTVQQAAKDFNYKEIEYSQTSLILIYVEKLASDDSSVEVCVYNRSTELIQISTEVNLTGAATNPNMNYLLWEKYLRGYDEHLGCCNAGKLQCAELSSNQLRIQSSYVFPKLFRVTGASQFVTPGGYHFVLNEVGVFWLFRSECTTVQIYTRTIEIQTEHSAVVIKSVVLQVSADLFRVNIVPEGLQIWLNQLPVNFYNSTGSADLEYISDSFTVHGDTYSVELTNTTSALFVFRHGISLKLSPCVDSLSINIIGSIRDNFLETYTGLLSLKYEDLSSSSESCHWIVAEEDILLSPSDQVYATYDQTNGSSYKGCDVSNTTFFLNSSSYNLDHTCSYCSCEASAEYEEIIEAARYRFPTASMEIKTSTTVTPVYLEGTEDENPLTTTGANEQEILDAFTKIDLPFSNSPSESTQVPTTTQIMDEMVGSDITSENDAVQPEPNNEDSPFSHHKILFILTGVFAGLAILAFAGTVVLYIRMTKKAANFNPEALPNWTVEYKP